MRLIIQPGNPLRGELELPGDKSLSHRAVLFAALAQGESRIENFLVSGVTRAMLNALSALGVTWNLEGTVLTVQGQGLAGLRALAQPIDCGNSATTLRLLAGAVAAAGIPAVLTGSPGLCRRPMQRIVEPLQRMGVPITASEGGRAPLTLAGREAQHLRPLDETLPVASAQVKSCLLLAALAADGVTVLREPGPSRDHTERMLVSMGVSISSTVQMGEDSQTVSYETRMDPVNTRALRPFYMSLPGDISSAAFLVVAGLVVPGSEIRIRGVGINPTRTGLLDALQAMGGDVRVEHPRDQGGEPTGDLVVRSSSLHAAHVQGPLVVRMIDEFSAFGAAAAYAGGCTQVREARELRYKESDRIATLCQELLALGIRTEELPDGFNIWGGQPLGGLTHAHGDHRLAMAMAVAGLAAQGEEVVEGAEMIAESFPEFITILTALGADLRLEGERPIQHEEDEREDA